MKYPILLVHGLIIKNTKYIGAFGSIEKALKEQGYTVYVGGHDGVGTVENNAKQLLIEVEKIRAETGAEKVNLIAHSKGGLDSRYLISTLNAKIASLTTLSTPHFGSKMSRKLLKMPRFCANFIAFFTDFWYKKFGDKAPNLLQVAREITDESLVIFNEQNQNREDVYYQSYSSRLTRLSEMWATHLLSRWLEGEDTDGMVSVSSARWGEYRGELTLSHSEMIGLTMSKKRRAEAKELYLKIARELEEKNL